MLVAYKECWKRAFDFSGTTRRKAYWLAVLANVLMIIGLEMVILMIGSSMSPDDLVKLLIPFFIFMIVSFLPQISLTVRRMRSAGYNPWKLLWSFVPFGNFYVLYCLVQPDQFD